MVGEYKIYMGKEAVGAVRVTRQGLYYHFLGSCALSAEVTHRLILRTEEEEYPLGVFAPEADGFGVYSRLAVKAVKEGNPVFYAMPVHQRPLKGFVPITAGEPFACLSQIMEGYFQRRQGVAGVVFEPQQPDKVSPTGQ